MSNAKKYCDKLIEFITCTLFLLMVAVACWQVLSRYILQSPSAVTEEFLRFSLIWLSMLGAAYVVGKNAHLAITFMRDRLPEDSRIKLDIVIQSIFLLFAAVIMVFGGGKAVSLTMSQVSPSLQIPMGYIYLSLPVSGLFILFYSSVNIKQLLDAKKRTSGDLQKKAA
ncbi:TRAP transporter small permease [Mesobacillus foraminis]|uniref:TRAP-type C4-dicarboxylate transport system permease small subunit n=1 Tax=Mesobacillus foraminis TaxID=279826 RepID=A0A4R2B4K8_9BACI|nr:TRAP transporter small permease [Mesobacillus foraminis]TCN21491.1 TRAP-type C4-dicarboxylate transport system permease small subunit [Mesobacillus foraminis]